MRKSLKEAQEQAKKAAAKKQDPALEAAFKAASAATKVLEEEKGMKYCNISANNMFVFVLSLFNLKLINPLFLFFVSQ